MTTQDELRFERLANRTRVHENHEAEILAYDQYAYRTLIGNLTSAVSAGQQGLCEFREDKEREMSASTDRLSERYQGQAESLRMRKGIVLDDLREFLGANMREEDFTRTVFDSIGSNTTDRKFEKSPILLIEDSADQIQALVFAALGVDPLKPSGMKYVLDPLDKEDKEKTTSVPKFIYDISPGVDIFTARLELTIRPINPKNAFPSTFSNAARRDPVAVADYYSGLVLSGRSIVLAN